jgi:hypothetical protein
MAPIYIHRLFSVMILFIVSSCSCANVQQQQVTEKTPPHILFVLIDDLGWGNVGYHVNSSSIQRQREVQTPVMDRLAKEEGLELNRHYVHHSCTGTRTSLQSGRFPVHVQTTLKNPEIPSSGPFCSLSYSARSVGQHQECISQSYSPNLHLLRS